MEAQAGGCAFYLSFASAQPQKAHNAIGREPFSSIVAGMASTAGLELLVAQSIALGSRTDSWPDLRGIDVPVLVAYGSADRICPPDNQRWAVDWSRAIASVKRCASNVSRHFNISNSMFRTMSAEFHSASCCLLPQPFLKGN